MTGVIKWSRAPLALMLSAPNFIGSGCCWPGRLFVKALEVSRTLTVTSRGAEHCFDALNG